MIHETAVAKFNLNLQVFSEKRADGYYPTHFINSQINLYDELDFVREQRVIRVLCDHPLLADNEENWVYQMAMNLRTMIGDKTLGATITLRKGIPIAAGFGGGSSDVAATARGLMSLWNAALSQRKLRDAVATFGKDAAYSFTGGLCEVTSNPDAVIPLDIHLPTFWLIVVIPESTKPSTRWMYEHIDVTRIGQHRDTVVRLKEALKRRDVSIILENIHNDFLPLAIDKFPEVYAIQKHLIQAGAAKTQLAGSGLSMVGFFLSEISAREAYVNLSIQYKRTFLTTTR